MDVSSSSGMQTGPQVVVQGNPQSQPSADAGASQAQAEPVQAEPAPVNDVAQTETVAASSESAKASDEPKGNNVDTHA